VLWK